MSTYFLVLFYWVFCCWCSGLLFFCLFVFSFSTLMMFFSVLLLSWDSSICSSVSFCFTTVLVWYCFVCFFRLFLFFVVLFCFFYLLVFSVRFWFTPSFIFVYFVFLSFLFLLLFESYSSLLCYSVWVAWVHVFWFCFTEHNMSLFLFDAADNKR